MPSSFRPEPLNRRDPIPAEWLRQITDHVLSRISFAGGLTRRVGNNLSISIDPEGIRELVAGVQIIFVRITASVAIVGTEDTNGNPTQWEYTVKQVTLVSTGYGSWQDLDAGFEGTAYNFLENSNDGTGIQNNGVDHDGADYPTGFAMIPVPGQVIVPAIVFTTADPMVPNNPIVEAWFWPIPNAEDGTCT